MSKNNNKNINKKDLSEKEVKKVSGGCCNPGGCIPEDPFERRRRKKNKPNWEKILKDLKPNLKDKSLNEKEIEKVSGGCHDPRGCIPKDPPESRPQKNEEIRISEIVRKNPSHDICKYGGAYSFPWNKKEKKDNKIIFNTDENANE